jgi:hypothetical protein
MERVVRVNAFRGSSDATNAHGKLSSTADRLNGMEWSSASASGRAGSAFDRGSRGDQGPCLYFGPAGQRCKERALAGGFCARHTSNTGAREATVAISPRKVIAILAAGIALWPILADVVRAILRYIR